MSTLRATNLKHASSASNNIVLDTSGNATVANDLSVTNDLKHDSGYGSVATAYGVRAWVNFNGTGTVAKRDDGNVSSITDNTTGDYTVNFSTAMPDANYCVVGSNVGSTAGGYHSFVAGKGVALSTSSCSFNLINHTGSLYDMDVVSIAVIR